MTDGEGNFRHERLFDGRGAVGREIVMMVNDGAFRIDDVPPGPYVLNAYLGNNQIGRIINSPFEVPEMEDKASSEPVDLGWIELE